MHVRLWCNPPPPSSLLNCIPPEINYLRISNFICKLILDQSFEQVFSVYLCHDRKSNMNIIIFDIYWQISSLFVPRFNKFVINIQWDSKTEVFLSSLFFWNHDRCLQLKYFWKNDLNTFENMTFATISNFLILKLTKNTLIL